MSEVFEGIAYAGPHVSTLNVEQRNEMVPYELAPGRHLLAALPARGPFSKATDRHAALLSEQVGSTVLIRYDTRIGHRSAVIYRNAAVERSYGEKDEIYVELDKTGEPILAGKRFRVDELQPEDEYETISNAIQLALEETGVMSWPEFMAILEHI